MLKLLPPECGDVKCGEIYYIKSSIYNVSCCLCGRKVDFDQFLVHFHKHLPEISAVFRPIRKSKRNAKKLHSTKVKVEEQYEEFDAFAPKTLYTIEKTETRGDEDEDEPLVDLIDLQMLPIEGEPAGEPLQLQQLTIIKEQNEEVKHMDKEEDGSNQDQDLPQKEDSKESETEEELSYACTKCERRYKTKRALQSHIRTVHNPNRGKSKSKQMEDYKCAECDEVFRSERLLRGHMWKHTGIFCDICGKPFSQTGNMIRHKVRHTGIKAHKCEDCGNCFYTIEELRAHMLRHTGKRPVICEVCGRPCRDRGVLTAHMRRHTGERPAKCQVCGKSFYSFYDLNVHAVAHTSERPFVCDTCGATFQRKKALRVHKKLHNKEHRHQCKVCGKAFAQSAGLSAHVRTHHGNRLDETHAAPGLASEVSSDAVVNWYN